MNIAKPLSEVSAFARTEPNLDTQTKRNKTVAKTMYHVCSGDIKNGIYMLLIALSL